MDTWKATPYNSPFEPGHVWFVQEDKRRGKQEMLSSFWALMQPGVQMEYKNCPA